MILEKKCKGVLKAKGYGCGELVPVEKYNKPNRIYGIGISCGCYSNWLLNSDEGREKIEKSKILGVKKSKVQEKKEDRKRKIDNKSIAQLIQEARRPFQKLIRIRDHGKKCICCDRPLPFNIGDYDAGHFLKAELYTGLIFHPDNINGQLVYCNKYSHGNESTYSDGLKERIGVERYNQLNDSKNSLKSYKWDKYKLIELKEYYTKELRLIEKGIKDIKDIDLTKGIIKSSLS